MESRDVMDDGDGDKTRRLQLIVHFILVPDSTGNATVLEDAMRTGCNPIDFKDLLRRYCLSKCLHLE